MSTADRTAIISPGEILWLLVAIAGSAGWAVIANGDPDGRAWRALLANFLFFTSLAGGLVVWPAVVTTCNGRWPGSLERLAAAGISFAIPSLAILLLLWIGSSHWSPWHEPHHQGAWLANGIVLGRDLAALAAFWGTAFWYRADRRRGGGALSGPLFILIYALVFSLLGFDLVMALDPHWYSTLAGGYFFISGLYIAVTGWAFLASRDPGAEEKQLQDLGRLVVAFSLLTTYMMYAHLLPIWYENLPHEVRFVIPRLRHPWRIVSYLLLAVVYFGPLVLLLTERSKRNRWSLGAVSLLVLAGMWLERWWLVGPTFGEPAGPGAGGIAAAAALAGMLGLGMSLYAHRPGQGPEEAK